MILPQFLKTVQRDYRLLEGHAKTFVQLKRLDNKGATAGKVFDQYAKKHPNKVCFYFGQEQWTYKKVEESSNQVGNYFANEGFEHKDVVSLFMENRPEHVIMWLGLSKLGVVTALINYNLRFQPLKHSLDVGNSKAIICGTELTSAITELGKIKYPVYLSGTSTKESEEAEKNHGWKNLDKELPKVRTTTPQPKNPELINFRSNLLYCYTSGTTGLPKAAVITNSRFFMASYVNHYASELVEDDRIYMTLPLYHVAGGVLGLSQNLVWGNPLIIRNKFSATEFFRDCYNYKATAAQYIAETSRFLLQTKESEWDKKHSVRVMFGNGFRKDIWKQFVDRFQIEKITEFYASTEGNANMVNYDNTVGAVGVIPPFLEKLYPIALVKVNEEGELIRNKSTGHLIRCKAGEVGELIGKIVTNSPLREFKGYAADQNANEKKTVRNVFTKGDAYFRSGDLLYKDKQGYHYFQDRMGDTFRWKSENVSTAEVEAIVSQNCELRDVIVFGVKVEGYDGAAGMTVIADPRGDMDIGKLEKAIVKNLPHYSRPLFMRITKAIPMTGTHKLQKTDMAKQAYDLSQIGSDKIYLLLEGKYTPFTPELQEKINAKKIKL
ncbi:long-chain fatty acid transport protein 4 [Folsomia candida]|uniref:Very long-chain fatty acid transport protein n=1 Tax=Folsomia candida TaxID=158441 RepID=A0A226F2Y3_FOLCA|nr:long-chain fatty acid transport protein 4 [Folsomia candida]OXA63710.1 Long-chain fatty acid transport protein 4 [Folsomia candida]